MYTIKTLKTYQSLGLDLGYTYNTLKFHNLDEHYTEDCIFCCLVFGATQCYILLLLM